MTEFRDFLDRKFPRAEISQLSGTNNAVFLVNSATAGKIIAKHVTDADIPLDYLARANDELSRHLPVQRVLQVFETERGDPVDALLCEYTDGHDLAEELISGATLSDSEIVDHLCDYVRACAYLPRLHNGFGLYKRSATAMSTHREFVEHYGRRYWNRARPFYQGTDIATAVDRWLDGGFAAAAENHPTSFRVISADANLKNWVVEPGGGLRVLNVPIAGLSTPAHAVGAVSLHLRNHRLHEQFLATAVKDFCPDDAAMVPHYELWGLLGILSFYAVRRPEAQDEWEKWGSTVKLDVDFRNLVESEIIPMVM